MKYPEPKFTADQLAGVFCGRMIHRYVPHNALHDEVGIQAWRTFKWGAVWFAAMVPLVVFMGVVQPPLWVNVPVSGSYGYFVAMFCIKRAWPLESDR